MTTRHPTPGLPARHDTARDGAARYGTMSADVARFLTMLHRIPIDAWWRGAESAPCADDAAWARLDAVMDTMPEVRARIRRRIDHEIAVCEGFAGPAVTTPMRAAAWIAAEALAARALLTPGEFARLYAPFATLIAVG